MAGWVSVKEDILVSDWVLVKEGIYRRKVGKDSYEYKYRVKQKDGAGNLVDTTRRLNSQRKPFRTLREVEAYRKAFEEELDARTERSVNVPNLHGLQEIFDDYVEKRGVLLAPNSLSKHRGDVKNHIIPHFKKRKIESITLGEIRNFITKLRENQAYSTTRSVLATMAKIWKYAYEMGIIDRLTYLEIFVDRATKVTVPELPKDKQSKTEQPEVYTSEQLKKFYWYAKQEGTVYYILLMLCYYGGVRLSEALGLRWQDIDWSTGIITVCEQLVYDKNNHTTHINFTKSKVNRVFQASPALLDALSSWKIEQESNCKKLNRKYMAYELLEDKRNGGIVKGGDFIMREETGKLVTHSKAGHVRERIQKKSGEHFYFHGLRHTVVSNLASQGVPLKNITDFIGHRDTRTTERFYLGTDELGEKKLMSALQNL